MDKYEYRVKTEQMQEYLEKKQYKKAMEIADTIDWRRVKNVGTLNTVSEIYEYNAEYQKSRDILFVAFDRSPGSRKIAYRLGLLALRINDIEEAADCYEEFVKLAPKDPNQYILKYRILRAQGAPLSEQIDALEEFKKAEYIEKWAYELARLYHEAGMTAECLEECDDLILWFSEGKYVYQAMELKMQYKPLTPLQQQKYDARPGAYKKSRPVKRDTSARVPVPLDEVIREEEPVRKEAVVKPVKEEPREETREEAPESMEDGAQEQYALENEDTKQPEKGSSITRVVKGATLQEAIASGMALANGFRTVEKTMAKVKEGIRQVTGQIHMDSLFEKGEEAPKAKEAPAEELTIEEEDILEAVEQVPAPAAQKRKPLVTDQKTSALRATGQMRIEEILQEWEAKQRVNAEAIERQREEDDERLRRERDEIELRKELERRDAIRRAEEESAARKAEEEEAVKKLAEKEALQKAAARKAEEEEAERKAAEEAARKAAEEEAARRAVEEAARKAAEEESARRAAEAIRRAAEEAERKAAEEEARRRAAEEEARRKAAEEEAIRKAAEEEAVRRAAEEEAARKAAAEAARREEKRKAAEELARRQAEEETIRTAGVRKPNGKKVRQTTQENIAIEIEDKKQDVDVVGKTKRIPDDIVRLMEELGKDAQEDAGVGEQEESVNDIVERRYQAQGTEKAGFEEEDFEEEDFAEESLEEDFGEEELVEEDFGEEGFEEESFEEDFDEEKTLGKEGFEKEKALRKEGFKKEKALGEEGFEEDRDLGEEGFEEEGFGEEDFEEKEDFVEEDFVEEGFEEEDFGEGDFEEESFEEEEDFGEGDFEEESFEEEEDFGEGDFEEEGFEEEEDFGEEDFEEEEDFGEEGFEEEEDFGEGDFEEEGFEEEEDFGEEDFEEEDFEEDDFDDVEDYIEEDEEFGDDIEEDDFEEDDYEEDELEEEDFEEEELEEEVEEEGFEEEDFEEEEDLEIEEPSEEEIQARIKKSKGKGVPFDTGFVVTGRYDLNATSEIGLKAGLTEEQKKLFSYFVPVRGMSEQIVEVLDNDRRARKEGTSKTGNLLVIGRKGSGKTVLAVDIVKAIQKQRNLKQGKVAIVTGESLNKKELTNIIQKLRGGAIIIEKAGKLNSRTVKELNHLMEKKTGELLFVLEDQRKPLERVLTANPEFKKKFTSKLELPIFINDELVTFGQTYAKENGYKLDEMGILALYSRIDVMQREDHAVSVAEVKDIMDEAIEHSQKANVKHLARRVFGRSTDESDRIILKEEDFKI